jgi:antagonist of KipI
MIQVLKPGLLTTIQDLGRVGYQQYGMVVSGALDVVALKTGNILIGNGESEAGLEITLQGPVLKTHKDVRIIITGGNLDPHLDECPIPMWTCLLWKKGEVLRFHGVRSGVRSYLIVAGGFAVQKVMGSKSTYLPSKIGGFNGRALQQGDCLPIRNHRTNPVQRKKSLSYKWIPVYPENKVIRVLMGPHDQAFTKRSIHDFLSFKYNVTTQWDRMGMRLDGPTLMHKKKADILSHTVTYGTVQVPGNGKPIILLADRQTTGGYTQIATVISVDFSLLAQSCSGDTLSFQAVSIEVAQELALDQENFFKRLKIGCD